MGRRDRKQRLHTGVDLLQRAGKLTVEQADRFKLMFSRCRTDAEFAEVRRVLDEFTSWSLATDASALLMRDDDWFAAGV